MTTENLLTKCVELINTLCAYTLHRSEMSLIVIINSVDRINQFTSALAQKAMQPLVQPEEISACLSLCPPVCHTPVLYQIEESQSRFLHRRIARIVSENVWVITKFERGHPERGLFMRLGRVIISIFFAIFRPKIYRIAETVQDRTKIAIDH